MSVPHRVAAGAAAGLFLPVVALLATGLPAHAATPTCHGVKATIVAKTLSATLHGTRGRDVIVGSQGNDTIIAGGGNDLVCGGEGSDHIYGGAGNDRLYGELDRLAFADEDGIERIGDTLRGGPGNDRLDAGNDTRAANEIAHDVYSWETSAHGVHLDLRKGTARGEGIDTFAGGVYDIVGSPHADVVEGTDRAEVIEAGSGSDVVRARGGADRIIVDGSRRGPDGDADRVRGGDGDDWIIANHGQDHLYGDAGNDMIDAGGASNDVIGGGDGNDNIQADIGITHGPQRWDGGPGSDGIQAGTSEANPTQVAATGTWDMTTGVMTLTADRTISLPVTNFERSLLDSGTPARTSWTVTGTSGDDSVAGEPGQPRPVTFLGLAGNDSFRGTDGNDLFDGGPGDDFAEAMWDGDDTCVSVETIHLADCEHVTP